MSQRSTALEAAPKADFSAIPLPPEGAPGETAAPPAAPAKAPEVAALAFLDPAAMSATVDLKHPFVFEGVTHLFVTVRRLTYADVLRIQESAPKDADGAVDLIEFYAVMTGLPPAVIRGMEAGDSRRLREAAYDFLPLGEGESASS